MSYSLDIKNGKTRLKNFTALTGTTTAALDLEGGTLVAILTPASISSTSATISAANDTTGTFLVLKDPLGIYGAAGSSITLTIASSGRYELPPSVTASLRYIKLILGSSETAKTFTAVIRNID